MTRTANWLRGNRQRTFYRPSLPPGPLFGTKRPMHVQRMIEAPRKPKDMAGAFWTNLSGEVLWSVLAKILLLIHQCHSAHQRDWRPELTGQLPILIGRSRSVRLFGWSTTVMGRLTDGNCEEATGKAWGSSCRPYSQSRLTDENGKEEPPAGARPATVRGEAT
jgi:hypothetical protein